MDQIVDYNVISQIGSNGGSFYVLIPSDWEPVGDNDKSFVGANFYVTLKIPDTSNSWLTSVQVLLY